MILYLVKSIFLPIYFFLKSLKINVLGFKRKLRLNPFSIVASPFTFGQNVKIQRSCFIDNVFISDYSYVSHATYLRNCNIGRFCSIANNVMIGLPKHDIGQLCTHPIFEKDNFDNSSIVNISDNVWIGAGAIIMPGLNIGMGAIVAAGAVVTKNVKNNTIVAGVPATVIKSRLDIHNHEKMLRIFENSTVDILKELL